MHEISLIRNVFHTLEAEFTQDELMELTAIDLDVGELSNVEPGLLQNAFEAVTTAEERYQDVTLRIHRIPVQIYCADCDRNSVINNYRFVCDACKTPNNNVVKGLELLINTVHFKEPAATSDLS